jgi:hypothetical protein
MASPHEPITAPDGTAIVAERRAGGVALYFPQPGVAPLAGLSVGVVVTLVCVLGTAIPLLFAFAAGGVFGLSATALALVFALLTVIARGALVLLLLNSRTLLTGNLSREEARGVNQLLVTDGSLVREAAGGGREVWDRDEIADIRAENYWIGPDLMLGVVLRSPAEEPYILYGAVPFAKADDEARAELEWIAAELRRALQIPDDPLDPAPPAAGAAPPSDAIMAKSPHVRPR